MSLRYDHLADCELLMAVETTDEERFDALSRGFDRCGALLEVEAELVKAVAVLREVEWSAVDGPYYDQDSCCPICRGLDPSPYVPYDPGVASGHAADCRLAALIGGAS